MTKKLMKSLAIAAVGSLLAVGSASALSVIEVSATGATNSIFVGDELAAGDLYNGYTMTNTDSAIGTAGVTSWLGGLGNFSFNMTAGATKPAIGSETIPEMHLNGFAYSGIAGGTFTVKFSETGFGDMTPLSGFLSSLDGASGVQTLKTYYDTGNALFATTTELADLSVLHSTELYVGIPQDTPFSLTMIATIDMGVMGAASFDNEINPVPEPATMLLLGTGLVGLAGARRRKKAKK